MNYFRINRIGEDPVFVSPDQADQIKSSLKQKSQFIYLPNDITLAASSIKSIEETDISMTADLLLAGETTATDEPYVDSAGSVKAVWVKKVISPKEWSYYKHHPSYHRLDSHSSDIVVGFSRVVTSQGNPRHLEVCSDKEMAYLGNRYE